MPTTVAAFQSMLSSEFKTMAANTAYGLPQSVFDGTYTATLDTSYVIPVTVNTNPTTNVDQGIMTGLTGFTLLANILFMLSLEM